MNREPIGFFHQKNPSHHPFTPLSFPHRLKNNQVKIKLKDLLPNPSLNKYLYFNLLVDEISAIF